MKLKFIKKTIPLALVIICFFVFKIYRKNDLLKTKISATVKEISLGRGGHHYYYDKTDYIIEDAFFEERAMNNLLLGDSLYKEKDNLKISIFRKKNRVFYFLKEINYLQPPSGRGVRQP